MGLANVTVSVVEKGKNNVNYNLESDIDGTLTEKDLYQFFQNTLINTAKAVLAEEQSRGFDKNPFIKVDGRYDKAVEQVNPLGKIQYISRQNGADILQLAYKEIQLRSKIVTGRYVSSNWVFFNGQLVAIDLSSFDAWLKSKKSFEAKDRIRFVNVAPYASKLELLGVTKDRSKPREVKKRDRKNRETSQMVRKPNGVYWTSFRTLKRKYGENSLIKFENVLGSEMGLTSPPRGSGIGRIRQKGKSEGRTYIYPSILVYIIGKGIIQ